MKTENRDSAVAISAPAGRGNPGDFAHVVQGTRGARRAGMRRLAAVALVLFGTVPGCFFDSQEPADGDIVGPYTGPKTRFVVDRLVLPLSQSDARLYGADLNGDDAVDNQLGSVISTLYQVNPGEQHVADRIAGGSLALSVEIQADDLDRDDRAGVWVIGGEGTIGRPVGGELLDGVFIPNFIKDTALPNTGSATIPLPIMADVDATPLDVAFMQISLVPDGQGGYDAQIHGMVRNAMASARAAIAAQLHERPELHRWMWSILDKNYNGTIEPDEWNNTLIQSLLYGDMEIGSERLLSVGIGVHLVPCPSGNCALSTPADHCFDRVTDGDEVDVDCGGSCDECPGDFACTAGDDCQSGTCTTGGVCTAPTCFDGVKNGFEASTDCGGACARKCEVGQVCGMALDCTSGRCSAGSGTGVCLAPL